jgi:hypothetical protein
MFRELLAQQQTEYWSVENRLARIPDRLERQVECARAKVWLARNKESLKALRRKLKKLDA